MGERVVYVVVMFFPAAVIASLIALPLGLGDSPLRYVLLAGVWAGLYVVAMRLARDYRP